MPGFAERGNQLGRTPCSTPLTGFDRIEGKKYIILISTGSRHFQQLPWTRSLESHDYERCTSIRQRWLGLMNGNGGSPMDAPAPQRGWHTGVGKQTGLTCSG